MSPDSISRLGRVLVGSVVLGDGLTTTLGIPSWPPPRWAGVDVDSSSRGTSDVEVAMQGSIGITVPGRTKRAPLESGDLLA